MRSPSKLPPKLLTLFSSNLRIIPQVFIDRAYDIDVADPTYYTKYSRYLNQKVGFQHNDSTPQNTCPI